MIEAPRRQLFSVQSNRSMFSLRDNADFRNRKSRQFPPWRGSEKQLIIFAAMQSLIERCAARDGDGGADEFGAYPRFQKKAPQVQREAVAKVHPSRDSSPQGAPFPYPRYYFPPPLAVGRAAQLAGHENAVSRLRAAAQDRLASRHPSAAHHIDDHLIELGKISPRQRNLMFVRQRQQAFVEAVDPASRKRPRDSKRYQTEHRVAAHRGKIRKTAGQRLVANLARLVSAEREVAVFQHEIGCENEVLLRSRPQNGAIVANALDKCAVPIAGACKLAYVPDDFR